MTCFVGSHSEEDSGDEEIMYGWQGTGFHYGNKWVASNAHVAINEECLANATFTFSWHEIQGDTVSVHFEQNDRIGLIAMRNIDDNFKQDLAFCKLGKQCEYGKQEGSFPKWELEEDKKLVSSTISIQSQVSTQMKLSDKREFSTLLAKTSDTDNSDTQSEAEDTKGLLSKIEEANAFSPPPTITPSAETVQTNTDCTPNEDKDLYHIFWDFTKSPPVKMFVITKEQSREQSSDQSTETFQFRSHAPPGTSGSPVLIYRERFVDDTDDTDDTSKFSFSLQGVLFKGMENGNLQRAVSFEGFEGYAKLVTVLQDKVTTLKVYSETAKKLSQSDNSEHLQERAEEVKQDLLSQLEVIVTDCNINLGAAVFTLPLPQMINKTSDVSLHQSLAGADGMIEKYHQFLFRKYIPKDAAEMLRQLREYLKREKPPRPGDSKPEGFGEFANKEKSLPRAKDSQQYYEAQVGEANAKQKENTAGKPNKTSQKNAAGKPKEGLRGKRRVVVLFNGIVLAEYYSPEHYGTATSDSKGHKDRKLPFWRVL